MSLYSYFQPANKESLCGEALRSETGETSATQVCAARELNSSMQDKEKPKKRQTFPENIKQQVAFHANKHGIAAARRWANDNFKGYVFKREAVRDWRNQYRNKYVEDDTSTTSNGGKTFQFKGPGRPSMVSPELTVEIKTILQNLRTAGCAISRKTVIAVGNGVLEAKCPESLRKNGGTISLTTKWARGVLKSMDWTKRRGTTAKRDMNPALYEELSFSWKKDISNLILLHDIPEELIFNLDQTPLALVSASKVTLAPRGSQKVPISNIDDKRQITGTYCVSMSGDFLPPQLIYQGKTDLVHPKNVKFPPGFHVTHSVNHWSNEAVHLEYLKKTVIPHINSVREKLNKPNQKALLIYDIFRGQTTGAVTELLEANNILSIKVPNNHTNLFQPLDLTVNKSSKSFMTNKYQTWYSGKVTEQILRDVAPQDVKVDTKLLVVKPIHARWIIEFYHHMQLNAGKKIIKNGFVKGFVREAFDQASQIHELDKNPFLDIEAGKS